MKHRFIAYISGTLIAGLLVAADTQPEPGAILTAAQAEAGRVAYEDTCGKCHTPALTGRKGDASEMPPLRSLSPAYQEFIGPRGYVPPLVGAFFLGRWGSRTAAQLIARFEETVRYFPPAGMNDETTVNITAYILRANGAKSGSRPLTRSTSTVVDTVTVK